MNSSVMAWRAVTRLLIRVLLVITPARVTGFSAQEWKHVMKQMTNAHKVVIPALPNCVMKELIPVWIALLMEIVTILTSAPMMPVQEVCVSTLLTPIHVMTDSSVMVPIPAVEVPVFIQEIHALP
jgi:hypothetical protein